eukprot:3681150-Pleurochrysis_carterae.AAC.1
MCLISRDALDRQTQLTTLLLELSLFDVCAWAGHESRARACPNMFCRSISRTDGGKRAYLREGGEGGAMRGVWGGRGGEGSCGVGVV